MFGKWWTVKQSQFKEDFWEKLTSLLRLQRSQWSSKTILRETLLLTQAGTDNVQFFNRSNVKESKLKTSTPRDFLNSKLVQRAREQASFWRQKVVTVASLLRVLAKMPYWRKQAIMTRTVRRFIK